MASDGVDHGFELAALGFDRRRRVELARRKAAADPVEANDLMGERHFLVVGTLARVGPLLLEVRDPPRPEDDRPALPEGRVGEAASLEIEVANLLLHVGGA